MKIQNVVLPNQKPDQRFDVEFSQDRLQSISLVHNPSSSPPSLLLPGLCHPHIHLDKPYLFTSHRHTSHKDHPDYSDLSLEKGGFSEALSKTAEAKTRYTLPDLILRGSQLIVESIQAGVTSMRAFAEVDHVTKFKCLDAAIHLKEKFGHLIYIQICAFAQDPIMSKEHGEENRHLMEQALENYQGQIEVLGATPYVEQDAGLENIKWAIDKAIEKTLHLDFHMDFGISHDTPYMTLDALRMLKEAKWTERNDPGKTVVFGHCTRISTFDKELMQKLIDTVADLPVAFVGLPTSDMFMMGRPNEDNNVPHSRERGTLQVVDMIQNDGLQACMGVNNVGNPFTPWGNADPLRLASLGVGVYHAGTVEQARILYECVSTRARRAIGLQSQLDKRKVSRSGDFDLAEAGGGGILMINNEENMSCEGVEESVPARQRLSIADVVWDPPEIRNRRILRETIS